VRDTLYLAAVCLARGVSCEYEEMQCRLVANAIEDTGTQTCVHAYCILTRVRMTMQIHGLYPCVWSYVWHMC